MTATNIGVGGFEGSGRGPDEFVISGCLAPTPSPCMKKNFTGFVRFVWNIRMVRTSESPWPATALATNMFSDGGYQR